MSQSTDTSRIKGLNLGKHWRLLKSFFQKTLWHHLPFIRSFASGFLYFLPPFFLSIIMLSMSSSLTLDSKLLEVRDDVLFTFYILLESPCVLCLAPLLPSLPPAISLLVLSTYMCEALHRCPEFSREHSSGRDR